MFGNTGSNDGDDAWVPFIGVDDNRFFLEDFGVRGEQIIDVFGVFSLNFLSFLIVVVEFFSENFSVMGIAAEKDFHAFVGVCNSAQAVNAGGHFGGDLERGDFGEADV